MQPTVLASNRRENARAEVFVGMLHLGLATLEDPNRNRGLKCNMYSFLHTTTVIRYRKGQTDVRWIVIECSSDVDRSRNLDRLVSHSTTKRLFKFSFICVTTLAAILRRVMTSH